MKLYAMHTARNSQQTRAISHCTQDAEENITVVIQTQRRYTVARNFATCSPICIFVSLSDSVENSQQRRI